MQQAHQERLERFFNRQLGGSRPACHDDKFLCTYSHIAFQWSRTPCWRHGLGTFLPLAAAQIYKPGLATPAPTDPQPSDIVTDPSDDYWIIAVAVVVPIIGIAAIGVAVFLYVRHRKLTGGTILSLI